MKKLLIATDNYLPRYDGIARFLSEVIPRLSKLFSITVVGPDFGDIEDPVDVKVVRFPVREHITVGDFHPAKVDSSKIRELVKESDVVFVQTIGPIGSRTIRIASSLKKPVSAYIHSIESELVVGAMKGVLKRYAGSIVKRYSRNLYNKCDLLFVPSESVEEILQWQGITAPMEIVHLGIDTQKFSPIKDVGLMRDQLKLPRDAFIIGYHGRIAREKDLMSLFRAFIRLQSKYPQVRLMIVGSGLKEILDVLAQRKGVILVAAKRHVQKYLQCMDCYALTSLTETTSLSTLEAMSCALPVVATKVGFIKDYIFEGANGFLIEKKSPYQLAKKIEFLIHDPDLRKTIGQHARDTVIRKFNWDDTVSKLQSHLERLE